MSLFDSKLWLSDIDEVIQSLDILKELDNKSLMITGCTGLVCSAVVDILIRWNEAHGGRITIYAAGRSEERVRERFAPCFDKDWFVYLPYDVMDPVVEGKFVYDYIIHGAGKATPERVTKSPVETLTGIITGTKSLLDYALKNKDTRILYVSSSEVYGKKTGDTPNKVDEYGSIDPISPRNSYSVGKCAAENLCASYADEYGIDTVMVRPGHIYGPTATQADNRVSSAWPYSVARGEDIVMKSDGSQIRSYCYCLDCAAAILTVLLKGKRAHAYNISNPASVISIKELAEILTGAGKVSLKMEVPTEKEKKSFNPMPNSSLDATELYKLGWKGLFDAGRGLSHTLKILKEIK